MEGQPDRVAKHPAVAHSNPLIDVHHTLIPYGGGTALRVGSQHENVNSPRY